MRISLCTSMWWSALATLINRHRHQAARVFPNFRGAMTSPWVCRINMAGGYERLLIAS